MFGILEVTNGPQKGNKFPVSNGETLVIGRNKTLDANLTDRSVGRLHCRVVMQADKAILLNLSKTSGTLVNGKKVEEQELQPGDIVQVGLTRLEFKWTSQDEEPTSSDVKQSTKEQ